MVIKASFPYFTDNLIVFYTSVKPLIIDQRFISSNNSAYRRDRARPCPSIVFLNLNNQMNMIWHYNRVYNFNIKKLFYIK